MGRSSMTTRALAAMVLLLSMTGAKAQTQNFQFPTVRDVRLDWCQFLGRNCGKPAADLYCRERGFDHAISFAPDPSTAILEIPTVNFGEGRICQGSRCIGFQFITCERRTAPEPPPPEPPPGQIQDNVQSPKPERPAGLPGGTVLARCTNADCTRSSRARFEIRIGQDGSRPSFFFNVSRVRASNGIVWQVSDRPYTGTAGAPANISPPGLLAAGRVALRRGRARFGTFPVEFADIALRLVGERRRTVYVRAVPLGNARGTNVVGQPSNVIVVDLVPRRASTEAEIAVTDDDAPEPVATVQLPRPRPDPGRPTVSEPTFERPQVDFVVARLPDPVVRPDTGPPQIKFTPLDPETISELYMGRIDLLTPSVEPDYLGDVANVRAGQIPVWDDETVFKWRPSNPQMADYYQLRFFATPDSATPIGSTRIDGSRTYARPGIGVLTEMLEDIGVQPGPQDDRWSLLIKLVGALRGNLHWEVAGYRQFNADGVAADTSADAETETDQLDVEVAVSERWPLRVTDRPNGFSACGPGEDQPPEFNKANILLENPLAFEEGRPGQSQVADEIVLRGQFSLASSPYASHPTNVTGPHPGGDYININIAQYRFENLFIDWGDGTVQPLTLDALDHGQYGRGSLLGLPPLRHIFGRAGTFTMRIFQVSESDLQNVNVTSLNVAHRFNINEEAKPLDPNSRFSIGSGTLDYYDALIANQLGDTPAARASATPAADLQILQGGFPLDVANRAYVIYCNSITLSEPKDEAAFGPLVLHDVDIEFDQTHAIDSANPVAARVSACDRSAQARAHLTYQGRGRATVVWKVNGLMIGGAEQYEIGPSRSRNGIEIRQGVEPYRDSWPSDWIPLEVTEAWVGGNQVTVEITVNYRVHLVNFGLLRPSREAQPGAPPVVNVPPNAPRFRHIGRPSAAQFVQSPPRTLTVVASDPQKPCHLRFVVRGGAFDVFLPEPDAVDVSSENIASGQGNMRIRFADQFRKRSVPIDFDGWQLVNGTDVTEGNFAVSDIADADILLPGLLVSVTGLSGDAGTTDGAVLATIDVVAEGGALRNANGSARAPTWRREDAVLAPNGDWYQASARSGIPRSLMGWSGFTVEANQVALDFSSGEGTGPGNACGSAGSDWIGVRLENAWVEPNLFDLTTVRAPVDDWVIGEVSTGNGLCGDLDLVEPVPRRPVREGHIAIDRITAQIRGGFVRNADYDMDVDVPLLGVTLSGSGRLMETAGSTAGWDLTGLSGPPTDLDLGALRLEADNYVFGTDRSGWRVAARTRLTMEAEQKRFATFEASGVRFGLDGRVRFDDAGAMTGVFPISGLSRLGETPVELMRATLHGPPTGADRLEVQIATLMRLSETLPASDVEVTYQVSKSGDTVKATGPSTTPFEIALEFPPADPAMSARIRPRYIGDGTSRADLGIAPHQFASLAGPFQPGRINDAEEFDVAQVSGPRSDVRFYAGTGDATVQLFGDTGPIQSAFVLGYVGNSDYWLTLTDYNLGPSGTPLVPPILNLFNVNGGLGYHVDTNQFVGLGDVRDIPPDISKGVTFLAGMTAGTADRVTFTVDGQLKMTEVEKARLDFTSWILKQKSGSTGDFTGFIEYGGGSLDGQLWGSLAMLQGAVKLSAKQGAVDVHFGSGAPWHIYLGRREGPKINVTLLDLGGTNGYLMLSGEGIFVGSGADIKLGGKVGPFSATVKGWIEAELGVEPIVPRVSGGGEGGLSVKGCAFGLCVGPNVSVAVKMAALPVDVSARACFKVNLVLKKVRACGKVSI